MDLATFMSRLARRATLDPESRHYNCNHCQVFTRIINGEDVFKAPVFEPIDGVALMSFLVIGEGRMKWMSKFFRLKGVKLPSIEKVREAKNKIIVPIEVTETGGVRIPLKTVLEKHC